MTSAKGLPSTWSHSENNGSCDHEPSEWPLFLGHIRRLILKSCYLYRATHLFHCYWGLNSLAGIGVLAGQVIYGFLDGPGSREGGDGQLFAFVNPNVHFTWLYPCWMFSPCPPQSSMPAIMTMLADHAARQLLDFNQKLDINLLDNVVNCLYHGVGPQVSKIFFKKKCKDQIHWSIKQ